MTAQPLSIPSSSLSSSLNHHLAFLLLGPVIAGILPGYLLPRKKRLLYLILQPVVLLID